MNNKNVSALDSILWIPHCGSKTIDFLHLSQQQHTAYTRLSFKCVSSQIHILSTGGKSDGGDLLARRAPLTNWASTSVARRLRRHNNHLALTSPQKSMHLPINHDLFCKLYLDQKFTLSQNLLLCFPALR